MRKLIARENFYLFKAKCFEKDGKDAAHLYTLAEKFAHFRRMILEAEDQARLVETTAGATKICGALNARTECLIESGVLDDLLEQTEFQSSIFPAVAADALGRADDDDSIPENPLLDFNDQLNDAMTATTNPVSRQMKMSVDALPDVPSTPLVFPTVGSERNSPGLAFVAGEAVIDKLVE